MHILSSKTTRFAAIFAAVAVVLATLTIATSADNEAALDTGAHRYIKPGPNDARSPCPALNVLANHGYLPRDGRGITPFHLIPALENVYGLSAPLAHLLSLGGFFLLHQHPMQSLDELKPGTRDYLDPNVLLHTLASLHSLAHNAVQYRKLDLHQIGAHNHIEHDASITHDDIATLSALYASPRNNQTLFTAFLADSSSRTHIDAADIGRARTRRERESHQWSGRSIDPLHAEIARGEAALVVSIFGEAASGESIEKAPWDGPGVPFDTIRTFWWDEQLPAGWRPVRETTIESIKDGKGRIQASMAQTKAAYLASTQANSTAPLLQSPQAVLAA